MTHAYTRQDVPDDFDYNVLPPALYYLAVALEVVSCVLSLMGSLTVAYLIVRYKRYKGSIFQRLMLGLTLNDFITSITTLLWPIATPDSTGLPMAMGNRLTCQLMPLFSLQGFGSYYYCGELSLYFLLVIRYGCTEATAARWLEPWVHLLPWLFALATSIAGFMYEIYTVEPLLGICAFDDCARDINGDCLKQPKIIVTAPFLFGAVVMSFIGIFCTWLVYHTVNQQEKSMHRYSKSNDLKQSKAVAIQAICYTAACLNGVIVSILIHNRRAIVGDVTTLKDRPQIILFVVAMVFFYPLQGFLNWIIYCRPSYSRWRTAFPDKSRWWSYRQVLSGQSDLHLSRSVISKALSPTRISARTFATRADDVSQSIRSRDVYQDSGLDEEEVVGGLNGTGSMQLDHDNDALDEKNTYAADEEQDDTGNDAAVDVEAQKQALVDRSLQIILGFFMDDNDCDHDGRYCDVSRTMSLPPQPRPTKNPSFNPRNSSYW